MTGIDRELSEFIAEVVAEMHAKKLAYIEDSARKREEELARSKWITEFLDVAERVFVEVGIQHVYKQTQGLQGLIEDPLLYKRHERYDPSRETWYDTLPYPVSTGLAIKLVGERNQRIHNRPMIGKARIMALAGEDEFTLYSVDSWSREIRSWSREPINEQQKEMAVSIVSTLRLGLEVPQTRVLFFSSH